MVSGHMYTCMYIQMKVQKIKDTLYFKLEGRNKVLIRDNYWINLDHTLASRQLSHQLEGKNIKWMLLLQGVPRGFYWRMYNNCNF